MNNKTIKEIIEDRIARNGMTKKAFANAIGRTNGSLNDLLNSPSWPSLEKMASVLGISVAELVSGDDETQQPANVCPHCGKPINIKIENPEV